MSDLYGVLSAWPWQGRLVIGLFLIMLLGLALSGAATLYYRFIHGAKLNIYPPWWTWIAIGLMFLCVLAIDGEARQVFVLSEFLQKNLRFVFGAAIFLLLGIVHGKETGFRMAGGLKPTPAQLVTELRRDGIPHSRRLLYLLLYGLFAWLLFKTFILQGGNLLLLFVFFGALGWLGRHRKQMHNTQGSPLATRLGSPATGPGYDRDYWRLSGAPLSWRDASPYLVFGGLFLGLAMLFPLALAIPGLLPFQPDFVDPLLIGAVLIGLGLDYRYGGLDMIEAEVDAPAPAASPPAAQKVPAAALWHQPEAVLAQMRQAGAPADEASAAVAGAGDDLAVPKWQIVSAAVLFALVLLLVFEHFFRTLSSPWFQVFALLLGVVLLLNKMAGRWPWLGLLASAALAYHAFIQGQKLAALAGGAGWLGLVWGAYVALVSAVALMALYTGLRALFHGDTR